jgi:hypothetical protein
MAKRKPQKPSNEDAEKKVAIIPEEPGTVQESSKEVDQVMNSGDYESHPKFSKFSKDKGV